VALQLLVDGLPDGPHQTLLPDRALRTQALAQRGQPRTVGGQRRGLCGAVQRLDGRFQADGKPLAQALVQGAGERRQRGRGGCAAVDGDRSLGSWHGVTNPVTNRVARVTAGQRI